MNICVRVLPRTQTTTPPPPDELLVQVLPLLSTTSLHNPIFRLKIPLGNEKCYQCLSGTHTNDVKPSNRTTAQNPPFTSPLVILRKILASFTYFHCFPTTWYKRSLSTRSSLPSTQAQLALSKLCTSHLVLSAQVELLPYPWVEKPHFPFLLQDLNHANHYSRIYFPGWTQDIPSHVFSLQTLLPSRCVLSPICLKPSAPRTAVEVMLCAFKFRS